MKAEFARLVEENASAPPGERLTEADMLIDPRYEEMLERQGKELCEEVGRERGNNVLSILILREVSTQPL